MKKILVVITTSFVSYGGLTNAILNYYNNLDKKNLKIDFASTNKLDISDTLYQNLIRNNSKYIFLDNRKRKLFCYIKNLFRVLKTNNYDIVHINGNSSTMILEELICKLCDIKKIIVHGHSNRSSFPIIHKLLRSTMSRLADCRIAVSTNSGNWLFKGEFIVLNNAIDSKKYMYKQEVSDEIRAQLGVADKFVIGHVGKLYYPKNHKFLIDVFDTFQSSYDKDSVLLLIGGGELESDLKEYVEMKGLENSVIFYGMCNDVPSLIQAVDIFVFPSIYEGLGLALIEAQASGLNCLASTNVPKETNVTKNIMYLDLFHNDNLWAKCINEQRTDRSQRLQLSREAIESITRNGFEIKTECNKLLKIYLR